MLDALLAPCVETYLTDDEQVLASHHTLLDLALDPIPDLTLIVVQVSAVEVPVSGVDGQFHRLRHLSWSRLQKEHRRRNPPTSRGPQLLPKV